MAEEVAEEELEEAAGHVIKKEASAAQVGKTDAIKTVAKKHSHTKANLTKKESTKKKHNSSDSEAAEATTKKSRALLGMAADREGPQRKAKSSTISKAQTINFDAVRDGSQTEIATKITKGEDKDDKRTHSKSRNAYNEDEEEVEQDKESASEGDAVKSTA